ncbi:hypothetical protein LMG28688_05821 [Paraburkholderia caffeinitolerans]|uniref:Transposase IS110-like N-terminal domain-containing protein n=1 Tax=Paraburkholderia caffeinitolerans TaxID=1723730 RepID=A0A6J5GQB0_9BURK|nr:hypothetical protein LMG28688_05821 [Paraburkholderia caffeinitolerans]
MEACSSAHHWARRFQSLGTEVRLISPQYVAPFVKTNKNDRNDAEAIVEAASRPTMRFVPVKSVEQQDIQAAHRMRAILLRHRTALINQMRGLLGERGFAISRSPEEFKRLDGAQVSRFGFAPDVTLAIRANLAVLQTLQQQNEIVEKRLMQQVKLDPDYALLNTVPGIVRCWRPPSCWKPAPSHALPPLATSAPTVAAWTAGAKATAERKVKATRRTATATWRGHLSKRPTSQSVRVRRPGAFTNARSACAMASLRSRHWHTSWLAPAITCFGSTNHLRQFAVLASR